MQELNLVFTPKKIGNLELENRIVFPAITSGFGSSDGHITDKLIDFYERRARGGVGCVTIEQASVHPSGRLIARTLRIDNDTYIPGFRRLAEKIHSAGARAIVQLNHTGRQTLASITGEPVVAPSAIPCPIMKQKPHALNREEIGDLVNAFGNAAARVKESGFDGVELQMGHGYLIAEFLSRYSNKRDDEYGGSLEKRMRFALEIMHSIRKRCGGEFPLVCKMSVDEMVPEGLSIEESQKIAKILVKSGADAIFSSVGCYESHFFNRPCYYQPDMSFVELAAQLKAVIDVPVIAAGKIRDLWMAEAVLNNNKADFIAMGRALIADPDMPVMVQQGKNRELRGCLYCNRCTESAIQVGLRCTINPELPFERERPSLSGKKAKKVLIVGGGPAGMEAAITVREKGHRVTLFEREEQLGGKLLYQLMIPGREHLKELVRYYEYCLEMLDVECVLNQECTLDTIRTMHPDTVIIASGSITGGFDTSSRPNVLKHNVFKDIEAFDNVDRLQNRVAVVGGGHRGTALADYFSSQGRQVTIIEKKRKIGLGLPPSLRFHLEKRLKNRHVKLSTLTEFLSIGSDCIQIRTKGKVEDFRDFDFIILAHMRHPLNDLARELESEHIPYVLIGDAHEPGDLQKAINEGRRVVDMNANVGL